MVLFTGIKASHYQKELASNSKSVNRGKRELKILASSINFDLKCGSSSRGRVKGKGVSVLYEAYVVILECEG